MSRRPSKREIGTILAAALLNVLFGGIGIVLLVLGHVAIAVPCFILVVVEAGLMVRWSVRHQFRWPFDSSSQD
jgi:hypothetical protein